MRWIVAETMFSVTACRRRAFAPGRVRDLVAVLSLLTVLAACGGEPLDLAPWVVPVPEGTPSLEYAWVPPEERDVRVELVRDLVITGDPDDRNTTLYRPFALAVSDAGDVYVLDYGDRRVQVYDETGTFVRSIGGPGQGPGEIDRPTRMTIAGDRLVVVDSSTARLSYWSLDGEYLGASELLERSLNPTGLADGSMVAAHSIFHREPEFRIDRAFVPVSEEGEIGEPLVVLPMPPEMTISIPSQSPLMAATSSGHVYVTPASEYQVLSYSPDGDLRWALRTDRPTPPVDPELIERTDARLREADRFYDPATAEWPEREPAIGGLAVDGSDNLWVFSFVHVPRDPMTAEPWGEVPEEVPVDVYSPDGEQVLAGMLQGYRRGWNAARGEHVYMIGADPDSGEPAVLRYRLVVPGE